MREEIEVEATLTTVLVDEQLYRIYEYCNYQFIDIIIRDAKGHRIDYGHPKFQAIGIAYLDSTPE